MINSKLVSGARCVTVWATVTAAVVVVLLGTAPDLVEAWRHLGSSGLGGTTFDRVLVWLCAAAAVLCAIWVWVLTTVVVLEAARGLPALEGPRWVPLRVRRLLLTACGVAALGVAAPATATPGTTPAAPPATPAVTTATSVAPVPAATRDPGITLDGLPLPDRAVGGAGKRTGTRREAPERAVLVEPGDSLWSIASARVGPDPDAATVTTYWHALHRLNADVIGDDPDLIHPGQQLRMPPAPDR